MAEEIARGLQHSGVIAYVDPAYLKDPNRSQISSQKVPFDGWRDYEILLRVIYGGRMGPVEQTPQDYQSLYQDACNGDPLKRPQT
ncbi:10617_t:CDS:2 [Racocetra persica]|uniref:10617_t:CDS:1 n=1 Tax=Racocetra persica TaxID=160502 RepID=A0ACA9LTJ0_9GLOM|nr:10617_t:CDS:2 [Racocetra persica]